MKENGRRNQRTKINDIADLIAGIEFDELIEMNDAHSAALHKILCILEKTPMEVKGNKKLSLLMRFIVWWKKAEGNDTT